MRSDNKTLYGIQDDTERYFLATWLLIVIISSLIEDSIILVATIKYKVLNLHKVIVAIIQHLAVCDLLQSIFRVFPALTAVIADKWIIGDFLCHVQDNFFIISNGFTMALTCALTAVKLLLLKYPLRARTWSKNTGHIICVISLILVLCGYGPIFVSKIFFMRDSIFFNYVYYDCKYVENSINAPSWYKVYGAVFLTGFFILCFTTLVVTSILILVYAQKVRSRVGGRVRLEGTITVLLTVAVQIVSFTPAAVVYVNWVVMGAEFSGTFCRAASSVIYLNIIANFYIYCITARSFREFLESRISELLYFLRQLILSTVPPAQN